MQVDIDVYPCVSQDLVMSVFFPEPSISCDIQAQESNLRS